MNKNNTVVISLGGSLIVSNGVVDSDFLISFSKVVEERTKQGERFFIITGGGATARVYQEALRKIKKVSPEELDWMGIFATRLNGELVRLALGKIAFGELTTDTSRFLVSSEKVFVGGGTLPGWTSDCSAVSVAKSIGAKKIINLSNIDFVYDKDPKKDPQARKIEKISWPDFRKLIPSKHEPGLNSPFDPIAAKIAEESGIEVAVLNGHNTLNLSNYLKGEPFRGTLITP